MKVILVIRLVFLWWILFIINEVVSDNLCGAIKQSYDLFKGDKVKGTALLESCKVVTKEASCTKDCEWSSPCKGKKDCGAIDNPEMCIKNKDCYWDSSFDNTLGNVGKKGSIYKEIVAQYYDPLNVPKHKDNKKYTAKDAVALKIDITPYAEGGKFSKLTDKDIPSKFFISEVDNFGVITELVPNPDLLPKEVRRRLLAIRTVQADGAAAMGQDPFRATGRIVFARCRHHGGLLGSNDYPLAIGTGSVIHVNANEGGFFGGPRTYVLTAGHNCWGIAPLADATCNGHWNTKDIKFMLGMDQALGAFPVTHDNVVSKYFLQYFGAVRPGANNAAKLPWDYCLIKFKGTAAHHLKIHYDERINAAAQYVMAFYIPTGANSQRMHIDDFQASPSGDELFTTAGGINAFPGGASGSPIVLDAHRDYQIGVFVASNDPAVVGQEMNAFARITKLKYNFLKGQITNFAGSDGTANHGVSNAIALYYDNKYKYRQHTANHHHNHHHNHHQYSDHHKDKDYLRSSRSEPIINNNDNFYDDILLIQALLFTTIICCCVSIISCICGGFAGTAIFKILPKIFKNNKEYHQSIKKREQYVNVNNEQQDLL